MKPKRWRCKRLRSTARVSARQERITGWDQQKCAASTGLYIGAGGANGEVCEGEARKGRGVMHIVDGDVVTPTNLNRQKFIACDLYKNKAICLCRNLSRQGFLGSELIAHPCWFQNLCLDVIKPDFGVCSVDMQFPETRLEVCRAFHKLGKPCVFFAVSTDADWGYVFVQEPGDACWACVLKPELSVSERDDAESAEARCPGVPACADILKALAGQVLYAIDTLVMDRKRDWNYRVLSLSRSDYGGSRLIPAREGCPVCGGGE